MGDFVMLKWTTTSTPVILTLVVVCGLAVGIFPVAAEEGPVLRTARGPATQTGETPAGGVDLEQQTTADSPGLRPHQIFSDRIRARIDVADRAGRRASSPHQSPAKAESTSAVPAPQPGSEPAEIDEFTPPLPQLPATETPQNESKTVEDLDLGVRAIEPMPLEDQDEDYPSHVDLDETERSLEVELSPEVIAFRDRIRRVLDLHYERPLDAGRNDVWEVMHSFLPYGVDAHVRSSTYREPINAIGWVCWNRPCKGKQLFYTRRGKLEAKQGPGVQGHHGQFLAMLAQCFVSQEYEIHVDGNAFTVGDLIEYEMDTCYPKTELTFKLIALSYYLPIDATWKSRDGQVWDLERLLREELAQKVIGSACGGTHRLAGIGLAVKKRKASGLPMDGTWAKAEQYLKRYHKYTFSLQNRDGSFSTSWFEQRGMDPNVERRLQTTGHILEYMLLTGDDDMLTDPRILRAVEYLTKLMESNPRRNWSIGPRGHALHALAIFDREAFGTEPGHRNRQQQLAVNDQESPR